MPNGWYPSGRLLYIEYLVGGQKVDKVRVGDRVEARPVMEVGVPGEYRVCLELEGRVSKCVQFPVTHAGTYYVQFFWDERGPAGTYSLRATLYGFYTPYYGSPQWVKLDERKFTYVVEEAAPTKPGMPQWVKEAAVVGISSAAAATASALIAGKGRALPAAIAGAVAGGLVGWLARKELTQALFKQS